MEHSKITCLYLILLAAGQYFLKESYSFCKGCCDCWNLCNLIATVKWAFVMTACMFPYQHHRFVKLLLLFSPSDNCQGQLDVKNQLAIFYYCHLLLNNVDYCQLLSLLLGALVTFTVLALLLAPTHACTPAQHAFIHPSLLRCKI